MDKIKKNLWFLFLFLFAKPLFALNIEQWRPAFDHLDFINLQQSRALKKKAWSFGLGVSYANKPVELGSLGSGARTNPLIDNLVSMSLNGAYGLADWVSVGLVVPFAAHMTLQPIGSTLSESTAAFGDVGIGAKFQLWEMGSEKDLKMGFSLSPFLSFPSGSESKYTGDTNITGVLRAIYDLDYQGNSVVTNLGLRFREKEDLLNLSVGQEFLYGLGFTRPLWKPYDLHVLTELDGSTVLNGSSGSENGTPFEWLFGLRKGFHSEKILGRLQATLGAGVGMTHGYGTPHFRVFGLLTYEGLPFGSRKEKVKEEAPLAKVEGEKIVIFQPIHFATNTWKIFPTSLKVVQSVADVLKKQAGLRHVVVEGHTDHRGTEKHNRKLSQNRARAVVQKLVEYGVEPNRLSAKGFGESQPVATNSTTEGQAQNRRTEFRIVEIQE